MLVFVQSKRIIFNSVQLLPLFIVIRRVSCEKKFLFEHFFSMSLHRVKVPVPTVIYGVHSVNPLTNWNRGEYFRVVGILETVQ